MDCAAEFLEHFTKSLDDGARSSDRIVNTPVSFQMMNQGVNGCGLKRIAANQQGMKTKHSPQHWIFDIACSKLIDRLIRLKSDEIGNNTNHVRDPKEGFVRKLDKSFFEDRFGVRQHLSITGK